MATTLWERRGACTHYSELTEYQGNALYPSPTDLLPGKIHFRISSWYQFIFLYFVSENSTLNIFFS